MPPHLMPCRLVIDPPADGAWNMAVDEALLDDAAERGTASLRFFQWREPTLSLGYFQHYAERTAHAASRGAAAVRRLSGGGALLHDRELTYSLCLPASHPLAARSPALYEAVHGALLEALAAHGVEARLHGCPTQTCPGDASASEEPFLCFARRTSADVVTVGAAASRASVKIAGSAQRRRRGAVLQHGAVLLAASAAAPELAGIAEAAGVQIAPAELADRLAPGIAGALAVDLQREPLEARLRDVAGPLRDAKYALPSWTKRR